jgi:nucleoside-diphosphate-sugar epimerase
MTNNQQLHVIFGTGPVGMAIMDELCMQGAQVRMVNRSGKTSEALPKGVELVSGDAADPQFATEAAQGANVIYFALNPPYHKWAELFPPLQAAVVAAAETTGAKLVVMENVYMYGDTDGKPLHEGLPYNAHTRKGTLRAQMHRDLVAAHEAGRIRFVSGRASEFYGPRTRVSQMGDTVFANAVQGKAAQLIGNPSVAHTQTYMPDIGRALVVLGQDDEAFGRAWHIPNAPAITQGAFIEKAFEAAGHPPKIQVLPKFMLYILGLFSPTLREFPEMMYEFEKPFIVEGKAFEERFGFRATPLDVAIPETVAWFQANQ